MWKRLDFLAGAVLAILPGAYAFQKPKDNPPPPKSILSEEDKEILKNRELLTNLELLQNFDKVRYLDFLSDKKVKKDKTPQGTKIPVKENANKN
jgi:hypothetical protein